MSYSQGKFLTERGAPYTSEEIKILESYYPQNPISANGLCDVCANIPGMGVMVDHCNDPNAPTNNLYPDALIELPNASGLFVTPSVSDIGRIIDGVNSQCHNNYAPGPWIITGIIPTSVLSNYPRCIFLADHACVGSGSLTCMKITGTYCDGSGQVVYDNVTIDGLPPTAGDVGTIVCCSQTQGVVCDPGPVIITQVLPPGVGLPCFELYTCPCPTIADPCAWSGGSTTSTASGNCEGNNCDGAATFVVSENPSNTPIPEPCVLTYDVTDQSGTSIDSGSVTCTSCWPGSFSHTVYNLCTGTYQMQVTIDNCTGTPSPGQTCNLPQTLLIGATVTGDPMKTCLTDPACCWLCDENNDCIQDPTGTHNTESECIQHCREEVEDDCCVDMCRGTTTGVPPCDNY